MTVLTTSPLDQRFAQVRDGEYQWSAQRTYLNAASWGPLPERARAAADAFDQRRQRAELTDRDFEAVQQRARSVLARLVGAQAEEIALMPNTSVGLNLAAHLATQRAQDGRRTIVISDREFPANVYPWLSLEQQGFRVQRVPVNAAGNPDEDALEEALHKDDVLAFSYSFVQFSTGFRGDLARFGRVCRARNILFVVDAIQGIGAVPLNVHDLHIDVLACGAQKWLCSPWGTGFVYVHENLCRTLEPYLPGWLAFVASRDFTRLVDYDMALRTDAQRFEVGSQPNQSCCALAESVELLLQLGIEQVYRHNLALQDRIIAWALERSNVQIVSNQKSRSGILCIRSPNAQAAHAALLEARITSALREGSIRLSPHFYNNESDIERVLATLAQVVS